MGDHLEKIYECDLHCHTNRSDGNASPEEVIQLAARRKVKVLAITDHDVKPPARITLDGRTQSLKEYGQAQGVLVIPGIEISCDTEVEDVHIIAMGCDWERSFFEELEAGAVQSKVKGYYELVKRLNQKGILIDWEEILYNDGRPIPKEKLQKKKIFEMIAKKGYAPSWQDAKLLVQKEKEFRIMREKPDPFYVIREIHKANGVSILAHPFLIKEPVTKEGRKLSRFEYIDRMVKEGLDGIEACYTYDKTSYGGQLSKAEIEIVIRGRYEGKVKMISGGSDYHADEKKGVKHARMLGECGVTMSYFEESMRPWIFK